MCGSNGFWPALPGGRASNREQTVEEFSIAFQSDAKIFGRRLFATTPLLFETRTRLCEATDELSDDIRNQPICFLDAISRDCVQKADGLVSDVVRQLISGFTEARSRLEQQWSRGEEASTEDLRVALKRYREFFDRLLAV